MKIFSPVKAAGLFLIGRMGKVPLENRVFNSICLIAIVIVGYNIPFNYLAGLPATSAIFAGLFAVLCCIYYLVRFRRQLELGVTFASLLVIALFAVNYFFSGGVKGASLLSFTLTFFLIMIISPRRQYWLWVFLCLGVALGLLFFEYLHPASVTAGYYDRVNLFVDMGSTYTINIVVIFLGLFYLKRAYYRERQSAEEKALHLEQLNNEKSKLFSIISHDLRAPLASIQTYLGVIAKHDLSREDRDMLELEMSRSVSGTLDMLTNMLVWSRGQLKETTPVLFVNNIHDVLAPVLATQRAIAGHKQIALTEQIDPSVTALTDINMLQLIVRNIVGNAIKFTHPGGKVRVTVEGGNERCIITVEDNGTGIPPEKRGDIFSLRAQSSFGTKQEKGIGLGLFLCKEYTEAQQGEIWFESEVGRGTKFWLVFRKG